jgi:hypothetical protein
MDGSGTYAEGDARRLSHASVKKLDLARQREGQRLSAISAWEIRAQIATRAAAIIKHGNAGHVRVLEL